MHTEPSSRERGIAALRRGDAEAAVGLLTEAVRAQPEDAEAWSALGVAWCQQQRLAEGVQALQRAVGLNPSRAPLHFNLARGLELTGQSEAALQSYRRALELDAEHAAAAQAVRRLVSASAPAASDHSDFVLSGPAPAAPSAPPPPSSAQPSAHAGQAPEPPPTFDRPSSRPGMAPTLPGVPYHPPTTAPPTRRSSPPWGLIAVALILAVAIGAVVITVLLPDASNERKGAQQARVRTEGRSEESTPPDTGALEAPAGQASSRPDRPEDLPPTDPNLDSVGGGNQVNDRQFGFSATFPPGFPDPIPQQSTRSMGIGGVAATQTYRASTSAGVAYILCYAFPPEVYDRIEQQLLSLGASGLRRSAGGTVQSRATQYQGYAAQDLRIDGGSAGRPIAGRARVIAARPRLFLIAFEARDAASADKREVTAYLDSLRIQKNVYPPSVQSPLQSPVPGDGVTSGR